MLSIKGLHGLQTISTLRENQLWTKMEEPYLKLRISFVSRLLKIHNQNEH